MIRGGKRRVGRPNRWEQVRSGEERKEEIEGFRQAWRGADGAAGPGEAGVNILSPGQTSSAPEAGPDCGFGMLSADAQSRRQAGVSLPWGVGWMPDGASVLFTYLESLEWSLFWDCPAPSVVLKVCSADSWPEAHWGKWGLCECLGRRGRGK